MAFSGKAPPAQPRRSFVLELLLVGTILYICSPLSLIFTKAENLQATRSIYQNDTGICKSMDIRNTLETFKRLEGCRVVEGFVQILLFDNVNETLLSNISFPELTEITDYLLLYRVNGLRSIGKLFPNLAVIRGHNLFLHEYSLVVFEMSTLQEIALYSLTNITKGLVRIDKNPSLCFLYTIEWNRISKLQGSQEHSIFGFKPDSECPICPGGEKDKDLNNTVKPCPKSSDSNSEGRLCWNRQHCQKICPPPCETCNDKGQCCNSLCLGGCSNDDVNLCTVCKYFTMGFGKEMQCMMDCPSGYYKYLDRRCVTKEECINMRPPIEYNFSDDVEFPYKIYNNTCILHCGPGYMNDYENHTCVSCRGKCKKECPGLNVDSVVMAQQLKGCTLITGSLEIQIRGGVNVVKSLEENLSMIEEIHGYLKIVRSFPLVSLSFFKNLRLIRGDYLESQKYAFVVLDNPNLQDLWNISNREIKISHGTLFFHFNPKLCIKYIENLRNKAGLPPTTEMEVATNSNGDKIACNTTRLVVNVTRITSRGAVLTWDPFKLEGDPRKLLAYTVYRIEAPSQNISLYDGRDACGGEHWTVDDVSKSDEAVITHPFLKLKPYTQYAFFVKTYTIATEKTGAQSDVMYLRTLPSMPSPPQSLKSTSNSSDSLKITWQPPLSPNGNITYYIVSGKRSTNENMTPKDRDYCNNPPVELNKAPHDTTPAISNKSVILNANNTCACDLPGKAKAIDESEASQRIRFEDELHNMVYVKKDETPRRKRESALVHAMYHNFEVEIENAVYASESSGRYKRERNFESKNSETKIKNVMDNVTKTWVSFSFPVKEKEVFINKLHHFTYYDISVQACREQIDDDRESFCSSTSMTHARTGKKDDADDIINVQIKPNQSLDAVTITWDMPNDPNGIIYSFTVEYKRVDVENAKGMLLCITESDFKKYSVSTVMSFTIKNLLPGNYSLRIKAASSAGEGRVSRFVHFYIAQSTSYTTLITIVVLSTIVLCSAVVLYYFYKRHLKEQEMRLIPSVNPEYVSSVYVPDEWEVPRENIKLLKELGQGSFGMVWEGEALDIRGKAFIRCAVKTVNEHATNSERMEFLNEASVMKAFDTAHVVHLLGVVSQGQPTLVIMELMAKGDLKFYLRSHRPDADSTLRKYPPTLKQTYQMAVEIADGMAYLAAKKFVHRDLAARNCMVAEDLTVKIGDFGMTRDIYETDYYRKGTKGLLPVRWMAPESLRDGVFTSSSDTWSYGVVLWEMATLASQPYQGLANEQVLRYVIDGGVMERPENCPDKLYNLMRLCWRPNPHERPSFLKICALLMDGASKNFSKVSFYHSAAGIEARTARPNPSPTQDEQTTPLRKAAEAEFDSQDESEPDLDIDSSTHISFPPTANGYGCPTNGAATTQC